MAIDDWFGVANDIVDIIAFVGKFVEDGSAPYSMGTVQFYDTNGSIWANNVGGVRVGLVVTSATQKNDTIDFENNIIPIESGANIPISDLISQFHNGRITVIPMPTPEEEATAGGKFGYVLEFSRIPFWKMTGLFIAVNTKVDFDEINNRHIVTYKGTRILQATGLYRDDEGRKSVVKGKKDTPPREEDGQIFRLSIPDYLAKSTPIDLDIILTEV